MLIMKSVIISFNKFVILISIASLKLSMSILLFSLIMKLFRNQSSMNVLFLLGEQHINMERVVKPLIVLNKWISSTKIIYQIPAYRCS